MSAKNAQESQREAKPAAKGNIDPTEAKLRKALENNPRNVQALYNLAMLHMDRNNLFAAIELFQRAAKLQMTAPILNNLGAAYRKIGRNDLAMDVLRKAIELDPKNGSGHYNYAGVLDTFGNYNEALEHLCLAGEMSPHLKIPSIAASAGIKDRMGMVDEAFSEILRLVNDGENSPAVLRVFCNILQRHSQYSDHIGHAIELVTEALNQNRIPPHEVNSYYFLLGHLSQKRKEYDAAFHFFELAHQHSQSTYNEAHEIEIINKIQSVWSATDNVPALEESKRTYIFIVGMPRSGSTLIEQILCVNEQNAALGECEFFAASLQEVLTNTDNLTKVGGYVLTPDEAKQIRSGYNQRIFRSQRPTALVTDKTLYNGYNLGQILQVFPNAKIIWTRRDPRDTCLSIYTYDFTAPHAYRHDLGTLGRFYNRYEQLLDFWTRKYPKQIHIAQYEDIIRDPKTKVQELIKFCGLTWENRYLDFHQVKRIVLTASHSQVTQPIYSSSVGRWKNYQKHLVGLLEELEITD